MSKKETIKSADLINEFGYGSYGKELSRLIKSIIMPGSIELAYGRDPDFFHGLEIQGKYNDVGICYLDEEEMNIIGFGTRHIKPMYINGEARDFGYLSGLRAHEKYRGGTTMRIFSLLYKNHFMDKKTESYFLTIIEKNIHAYDALVSERPGMPRFVDSGKIFTHAINVNRRKKLKPIDPILEIKRGNSENISRIVHFLNKEGRKKQFFPVFSEKDFQSNYTRDFDINDFYVAYRKNEIVGIVGKWDQHKYKQSIVMKYNGAMKIFRPVLNLGLKLLGYNILPDPGSELNMLYLSFVCIKDNDIDILDSLINSIHFDNKDSGYHYMIAAFHEKDPLYSVVKKYSSIKYTSVLFVVDMEPDKKFSETLNKKFIPYVEIGTL